MQRIGILFEYGTLNGGEHSMLAAIDHLQDRRFQFVILAPQEGPLQAEVTKRNLPLQIVNFRDSSGTRISPAELASNLNQIAADSELEVIHANSLTMGRHLGAIANQLNVPTTSHIRDIMSLSKAAIRDLNQHQKLIAVSDATREFHINQGIDPARIQRVYNGVDCEKFQPRESTGYLRKQLSLPANAILIATIGQICLRKAQVDLAEAAVVLKDQNLDLYYLIVGERHSTKQESIDFDQRISDFFVQAGMAQRLHRLGYVANISELMNEIDLLVHPARQEPLGRVLLEAAASGVPIIATSVGGTLEILQDRRSALIVEPQIPSAITSAIQELLSSDALQNAIATRARQVAIKKFNIPQRADELCDVWQQVLIK